MGESEAISSGGEEKNLSKYQSPEGKVLRWLKEIDLVKNSKQQKAFEKIGEKITKIYKNADAINANNTSSGATSRIMLNVLWAYIKVMRPSLFSRLPKIYVERTFKDIDPIGRLAALGCERATHFAIHSQQDRALWAIKGAVLDKLLVGRGQAWPRYTAEFEPILDPDGEPLKDKEGNVQERVKPNSEKVLIDPLNWLDYMHSLARNPFEIRWQKRTFWMTRAELIKEFGEKGREVKLGTNPDGRKRKSDEENDFLQQAEVHLISDFETKSRIWISEGYKKGPLKEVPDNLKLSNFWECPIPLLATTTTDSMYPTPDYKIWERLAEELDYVTKRISAITECVRIVGMAAASLNQEIKSMLKLNDGEIWPVQNWTQFMEKGGLSTAINWFPFDQAVAALPPLIEQQQNLLNLFFQITGMNDVVMGASNPTETLGAQQLKSHFTVVKIVEDQQDVQRFCRELYSKVAEMIFEPGLFSDETIFLMAGVAQMSGEDQQNWPLALQLLRDDRLRTFRIEIETDSTIAVDLDKDKADWSEYVEAVSQLVSNIQNISSFRPELLHPIIETAKQATRALRTGRSLEAAWDRAWQKIEDADEQAKLNPPPVPPDYENQKLQIQAQETQIKQSAEEFRQWLEQEKLALQAEKQKGDFELSSQELQIKAEGVLTEGELDKMSQALEAFKFEFDKALESEKSSRDWYKVVLDEREKFLEETRLRSDETTNKIKEISESREKEPKQPLSVHIHQDGGEEEILMERTPTGGLVGRKKKIKPKPENIGV